MIWYPLTEMGHVAGWASVTPCHFSFWTRSSPRLRDLDIESLQILSWVSMISISEMFWREKIEETSIKTVNWMISEMPVLSSFIVFVLGLPWISSDVCWKGPRCHYLNMTIWTPFLGVVCAARPDLGCWKFHASAASLELWCGLALLRCCWGLLRVFF